MRLGRVRYESKYLAIEYYHVKEGWSIRWMCRQLGVSKAAYYKWLYRAVPQTEQENLLLAELIQEYDEQYNHILGYRRMTLWINRLNGTHFSKNRVHRIMKALNISAILDLYDRSVVAYVLSRRNDNRLVFQTFEKAIASNPSAKPIFHSDRGFQYTSPYFQSKLDNQGMVQSMSRVAHCIDNGPAEGFWGIIKAEMYYLQKFDSEKSLRTAIDKYIHFYNYERFQERFGGPNAGTEL